MLFRRVSPVIPRIRLGRIPVVAVIRIGIDPILLGTVHLFGVFYAVAFMVAFRYGALPHVQHYGVTKRQVDRILVWTIIMGLLGARLYYDVQSNFWDPWGVYRLWRDGGFAIGALLAGIVADLISIPAAIYAVAALTAASGIVVAVRMYETHT